MKFIEPTLEDTAADSLRKDLGEKAQTESQLAALQDRLRELPDSTAPLERTKLELEISRALMALERGDEAWPIIRPGLDIFIENEDWLLAADACDVLYKCNTEEALCALGHGVWIGVTFPIDTELTIALLQHIVEDTPDDSDGAAVAAATALFIADVRSEGKLQKKLRFFASQLLGNVARRHSDINNQEQFQLWIERLELDDPDKFLIRLRNVVDVLVQDDWWLDREAIQARLPIN